MSLYLDTYKSGPYTFDISICTILKKDRQGIQEKKIYKISIHEN